MIKVFQSKRKYDGPWAPEQRLACLDGGGNNGAMDTRRSALEDVIPSVLDRLTKFETRLDHIPHNVRPVLRNVFATQEDVLTAQSHVHTDLAYRDVGHGSLHDFDDFHFRRREVDLGKSFDVCR